MIPYFERTQRWELGGSPLDHETASRAGITHGDALVQFPKRKLAALLLHGTLSQIQALGAELAQDYVQPVTRSDVPE